MAKMEHDNSHGDMVAAWAQPTGYRERERREELNLNMTFGDALGLCAGWGASGVMPTM
jgi:hypothetical protein